MEDTEGTTNVKIIGLIEKRKATTEENCLLCKSRFYKKFTDSKLEPSFGVVIEIKDFSIAKIGPIESAHFGNKEIKQIGFVEGYFP